MKTFLFVALFLLAGVAYGGDFKIGRVTQMNYERLPVSNINMFSFFHGISINTGKFELRPLVGIVKYKELGSTTFTFKITFEFRE
jgi:hypothetical protein